MTVSVSLPSIQQFMHIICNQKKKGMRVRNFITVLSGALFLMSCKGISFSDKYSADSAKGVLAIGERIGSGEKVEEETWVRLFESDGYAKYLSTKRGAALSSMIKEAMMLAFSADRRAEADSLMWVTPNANDYQTVMCRNFYALAGRKDEAVRFMNQKDFPSMLSQANQLVREYLPKRAVRKDALLNDLYLICTIPDASVRNHSVLLDLNLAMDMTDDEVVQMLAHEFFHNYRGATLKRVVRDSFWRLFNSFEDEGIADLIDKGDHPETMYARYGDAMKALYLDQYQNASATLRQVDSLLTVYQTNPVEGEYVPVANLLVFNGHPTGYYMTRLIREEGLMKELIQVFDSPAAFAELYNKAAMRKNQKGGRAYILSENLLSYLKEVGKSL